MRIGRFQEKIEEAEVLRDREAVEEAKSGGTPGNDRKR